MNIDEKWFKNFCDNLSEMSDDYIRIELEQLLNQAINDKLEEIERTLEKEYSSAQDVNFKGGIEKSRQLVKNLINKSKE